MEPPIVFERARDKFPDGPSTHVDDPHSLIDLLPSRLDVSRDPETRSASTADIVELLDVAPCCQDKLTCQVQRIIDVVLSAVGLLFFLPLTLLIAVAIKLDSRGPVLYMQRRVGYCGVPFPLFKFRSMTVGAELRQAELWADNEREGPVFKIRHDPRVTRVGRFLRRFSIDEVPQLLNVLRGEMSLVGPRPALPLEVAMYTPRQMQRLCVTPGLTGLWQISGRANLNFDQSVDLDLRYIRTRSIGLNLWILLRTIPAVIRGEGAY